MDSHYYDQLRTATQDEFYEAVNDPDHELYDILWDVFESVVIEPAEIFDEEFGSRNQFRYSIDSEVTMEFFPDSSYFEKRLGPSPYKDGSDAAGIHLKFSVLPDMSCLFSVSLQIWGKPERQAFRRLWREHRGLLSQILGQAQPMIEKRLPNSGMDFASSVEEMLDNYFGVRDSENFLEFRYPFAQFDETDQAQNFMTYMALIYHSIRGLCETRNSNLAQHYARLEEFFSGYLPKLPPPLPCVELAFSSDG